MQVKARGADGGHARSMSTHRRMLIVVADGEHARFVRAAADGALHTVSAIDSTAARKQSSGLGSDRPGATFHSDASVHHSLSPRSDPHMLAEERFAQMLAREIGIAMDHDPAGELVLAAPPRILNAIRERLADGIAARIVGMLGKDLTKVPDQALRSHLRHWLDAPPRTS